MKASHRRSLSLVVGIGRELNECKPKAKHEFSRSHVIAVIARELGEYKSQTQYEPSRRHVDAVSESESKDET